MAYCLRQDHQPRSGKEMFYRYGYNGGRCGYSYRPAITLDPELDRVHLLGWRRGHREYEQKNSPAA